MLNFMIYLEDERYMKVYREVMDGKAGNPMVTVYRDPREALYAAAKEAPDLMIADIRAVRKRGNIYDGFVFLDMLRKQEGCRFIPLLIVSDLEDETLFAYNRLHCYGFYPRPLNRALFEAEIDELCRYLDLRGRLLPDRQLHFFRRGRDVIIVREGEIIRYERREKKGTVVTTKGTYVVNAESIRKDTRLSESPLFIRCNRSDYVNAYYIREFRQDMVILDYRMESIALVGEGRKRVREYLERLMR